MAKEEEDPIAELEAEIEDALESIATGANESIAAPIRKYIRFTILPLIQQSTQLWIERTDELADGIDDLSSEVESNMPVAARDALASAAALAVKVLDTKHMPEYLISLATELTDKLKNLEEDEQEETEEEVGDTNVTDAPEPEPEPDAA
jgi:hypothetical protein